MKTFELIFQPVDGLEPAIKLPDYGVPVLTLDSKKIPMVCIRWKTDAQGEHWLLHEYGGFELDQEDAEWHEVTHFAELPKEYL